MRAGALVLAVGTGGAAPALTRRVKEKLRHEFDGAFAAWVDVLAELRPEVMATIPDLAARKAVFDALADWPWLDRVQSEGADAVRKAMQEFVRKRAETRDSRPG